MNTRRQRVKRAKRWRSWLRRTRGQRPTDAQMLALWRWVDAALPVRDVYVVRMHANDFEANQNAAWRLLGAQVASVRDGSDGKLRNLFDFYR